MDDNPALLRRLETLIAVVGQLAQVQTDTRDAVLELMAWLQRPSDSDLPELIRTLVAVVQEMQTDTRRTAEQTAALGQTMLALAARVTELRDAVEGLRP